MPANPDPLLYVDNGRSQDMQENVEDWPQPGVKVVGIDDLSGGYKKNINPEVEFWQMNLVER